jgi:DNA-binding transcriptional MerR regulator
VPADPTPKGLTTREVAEAIGLSEPTILRWGRLGVLPEKVVHHGGRRGRVALWPGHTIAQARWVITKLDAHASFEEIKAALEAGEFTP